MRGYNAGYNACSALGGVACAIIDSICNIFPTKPAPGDWVLDVKLTNPNFGVKDVWVDVKGPFGYKTHTKINWQQEVNRQGTFGPIHVKFNIPVNVIPVGYKFQVCTSLDGNFLSGVFPYCQYFTRIAGVSSVTMNHL